MKVGRGTPQRRWADEVKQDASERGIQWLDSGKRWNMGGQNRWRGLVNSGSGDEAGREQSCTLRNRRCQKVIVLENDTY